MTLKDGCRGFPKRPYFVNFVKMVTHGEPLKNALRGLWRFRSVYTSIPFFNSYYMRGLGFYSIKLTKNKPRIPILLFNILGGRALYHFGNL